MNIRPATPADIPAITAIYAHHVLTGTGTFEETPPSEADMTARLDKVLDAGAPWLVSEDDSGITGFAYAAQFRDRSAYRYTAEDSIYIRPDRQGQGVGAALLAALIQASRAFGFREILAVIGDSDNAGCTAASVLPTRASSAMSATSSIAGWTSCSCSSASATEYLGRRPHLGRAVRSGSRLPLAGA